MPIGCAEEYTAYIVRQPGNMTGQGITPTVRATLVDIQDVQWGRRLSDVSTASITVSKCHDNCSTFREQVDPWAHELWIYRDNHMAWQGPITYIRETKDAFVLSATDIVSWIGHREIINAYSFTGVATAIANNLLTTFFPSDDPDLLRHVFVIGSSVGSVSVEYDRAQYVILDKWNDLKRMGLNYTTMARYTMIFGDIPPNINSPHVIDAGDILGEMEIIKDGIDFGNHIVGLGEGLASGIGPTVSSKAYYGKVTFPPTRFSDIRSQADLDGITNQFYLEKRDLSRELVIPAGSTLSPTTDISAQGITINTPQDAPTPGLPNLVPGMRYDVQVGEDFCSPGRYPMKLSELQVTWTPEAKEKVAISLAALRLSVG